MRELEAQLSGALGELRATVLFRELRDSTFLAGGTSALHLSPAWGSVDEKDPFSEGGPDSKRLDVKVISLSAGGAVKHSEPVWLEDEDTSRIIERYGHILGVETPEALQQVFDKVKQQ